MYDGLLELNDMVKEEIKKLCLIMELIIEKQLKLKISKFLHFYYIRRRNNFSDHVHFVEDKTNTIVVETISLRMKTPSF